ncbi:hypothetical protein ACVNIS_05315 [Sphaerotilaceae bacterium SBD11-9]
MPTHIRALVVIILMAAAVLWLGRRAACEQAIDPEDYKRRAKVWLALTLLAFLSHNYWLFVLISVPMMAIAGTRDSSRLALYFFVLFAIPLFQVEVSGFGVFERLLAFDHTRWLALVVLLPAYWALRSKPDVLPFGRTTVDKFILAYMVLWFILQLQATTLTNLFRITVYLFIDTFLPYYVSSRALRNLRDYRDALMSLVVALLIMSPMAAFELARSWLLYNGVEAAMGQFPWGFGGYLGRGNDGPLRALVSTGHPIALGYFMAVGLSIVVFLRHCVPKRWWVAMCLGLMVGLLAAMSRGPWVGGAAAGLVLLITGPKVASKIMHVGLLALVLVPLALSTDEGRKMIDYLPFVGTVESANVEFRQRLVEVSLGVLSHFPYFGALDYMSHPDMEQMRGGDGIIDMVNTYLSVAMLSGVVGLSLFAMPFILVMLGLMRQLVLSPDKESEMHTLGRALLAAMVGTVVTIGTVAPIVAIPAVYLSLIGLSAGFMRMAQEAASSSAAMPIVAPRVTVPDPQWSSGQRRAPGRR